MVRAVFLHRAEDDARGYEIKQTISGWFEAVAKGGEQKHEAVWGMEIVVFFIQLI